MDAAAATPAAFDTVRATIANRPLSDMRQIDATAKEFEAMFLSEMLAHMFSGIESDPMFGGGHGEDMFRGLLVSEYGKEIAKGTGIGISDQIRAMMIDLQQQKDGV